MQKFLFLSIVSCKEKASKSHLYRGLCLAKLFLSFVCFNIVWKLNSVSVQKLDGYEKFFSQSTHLPAHRGWNRLLLNLALSKFCVWSGLLGLFYKSQGDLDTSR